MSGSPFSGNLVKDRNLTILANYVLDQEQSWSECVKCLLANGKLAKMALMQVSDGSLPDGYKVEGEMLHIFISLLTLLRVYHFDDLDQTVLFQEDGYEFEFKPESAVSEEERIGLYEEFIPISAVDELLSRFGL